MRYESHARANHRVYVVTYGYMLLIYMHDTPSSDTLLNWPATLFELDQRNFQIGQCQTGCPPKRIMS